MEAAMHAHTRSEPLFYVNGKQAMSAGLENLSLNEYIRQYTPYKGTKLACGEGGCGACAVQVARYDPATDRTTTSSVNSCLCPVGSLDGASITTVEGFGSRAKGFSAVQEQFAQRHASQCGFCTPGFVVACHAALAECSETGERPESARLLQGLDGNLCRCTGYAPIVEACKSLTADIEDVCRPCSHDSFPKALKEHVKERQQSPAKKCRPGSPVGHQANGSKWISPHTLSEVIEAMRQHKGSCSLLAGNTGAGVYHEWPEAPHIINLLGVRELRRVERSQDGLEVGAAVPFAEIVRELRRQEGPLPVSEAWRRMADHIERIAGTHVRWAATPGGNLALLRDPAHRLESDFGTVLAGAGGRVEVSNSSGSRWLSVPDFLDSATELGLGVTALVTAVSLPTFREGRFYWSHKVAQRFHNAHALVNLAISWTEGASTNDCLEDVKIAVGCPTLFREGSGCAAKVAWQLRRAQKAEAALEAGPMDPETLATALEALQLDICPGSTPDAPAEFYRATAEGLLFEALSQRVGSHGLGSNASLQRLLAAEPLPPPGVPKPRQTFPQPPEEQHPAGLPIEKDRIRLQASGEAVYSSDIGVGTQQLYASVVASDRALAAVAHIDPAAALKLPGVVAFVGPEDIPGENSLDLGGKEAQIFASEKTEYVHQPLGVVVAESPQLAKKAAELVSIAYSCPESLGDPIFSITAARAAGSYHDLPDDVGGKVHRGNVAKAMAAAEHVIKAAKYTIPSQQHFYLETQAAVVEPQEGGTYLVHSSTQTLDGVQAAVARALGLPAHNVTAVCRRAGGGFGGKVARSMPVAAAAAVAAHKVGRPVHYQLDRNQDLRMNGGRSEAEIEYDVGFDGEGRISALSVRGWFLAGADLDLAWNDMMVLQAGADQVYNIPNMDLDLKVVRTNLAPRTIMRGPGFMDAVLVIEQVLEHVAGRLRLDPEATRRLNFLRADVGGALSTVQQPGFVFSEEQSILQKLAAAGKQPTTLVKLVKGVCARALPSAWGSAGPDDPSIMRTSLGRPLKKDCWTLPRIWDILLDESDYHKRVAMVAHFNQENAWRKRGISIHPCRFDCAPQPMVAQANIYHDGSILLTHGGLEVGQGLSTKVKQTAAYELSKLLPEALRPLPLSLFRINDTRSDIVPNSGPTWSSTGSEASCAAIQEACSQLVASLREAAGKVDDRSSAASFWRAAVARVHAQAGFAPASVQLSAVGFFDGTARDSAGSEPLTYSSFGAAVAEVEIDVLSGEKVVKRVDIHFDCGRSLNPMIDMGQVEGAFVQGLGYLTSEDVVVDEDTGRLVTDGTWKYKPPAAGCIPQEFNVTFLKDSPNPRGVLGSKASGEPCLLLTTSILHALRHAVVAARAETLGPTEAHPSDDSSEDSSDGELTSGPTRSHDEDFFVLAAPATTVKLKQACGHFSVASMLRKALGRGCSSDSASSWVKVASDSTTPSV